MGQHMILRFTVLHCLENPTVLVYVLLNSSQETSPCFHCLCSALFLSLTSISCLGHACLFPSLPDSLHLGIESSGALWNISLKTCQLCSVPLSLRTVSQGVLLTISLKSWKFALLCSYALHYSHFPQ